MACYGSWAKGINKGLAAQAMQRGPHVSKARPCVTEAPAGCADRQHHHALQDERTCRYSAVPHC
jgi:hypothetical protein